MMRLTLLFLLVFCVKLIVAQTPYNYPVKTDLQDHQLFCIDQDDQGRLLLGTDKGLYLFNGFKSKRLASKFTYSKEIIQLLKTPKGFFAVNKTGQLLRVSKDSVVGVKPDQFTGQLRKIALKDKQLLLVSGATIFYYELESLRLVRKQNIPFTQAKGVYLTDFFQYNKRDYALLNTGELVDINDQSARSIPSSGTRFISEWNKHLILIPEFIGKQQTLTFADGIFRNKGRIDSKHNRKVLSVKVVGGNLYLFVESGVYVFSKSKFSSYYWFEDKDIQDVFVDKRQNKWFASKNKGLYCIPAGNYSVLRTVPYLSLEFGPNNTIYGGLSNGSIHQFETTGKQVGNLNSPQFIQEIFYLRYNAKRKILFTNSGIFIGKNSIGNQATSEIVKGVCEQNDGTFVVATTSGLKDFKSKDIAYVLKNLADTNAFDYIINSPVRQISRSPLDWNKVAINTIDGVFLLDETGSFLELKYYSKSIDAQQIAWYSEELFVVTADNKLLNVKGKKVVSERLISDNGSTLIVQKLVSTKDFLYLLTEKGIYRMKGIHGKMEAFKDAFSLNGLSVRDFIVKDQTLYLATQYGVMKVEWKNSTAFLPKLILGLPFGNDARKNDSTQIVFGTKNNLIVFPFECVDLTSNKGYQVQYRLVHDEDTTGWSIVPSENDKIQLSFLGSGAYIFELRSIDLLSEQVSPIERTAFSIEPSWYENTWWIWFLLGGAMVYTTLRFRRINRMRLNKP